SSRPFDLQSGRGHPSGASRGVTAMTVGAAAAAEFEYIVVGSGAGGGTVAARLAESGCRVLLLEAGGDPLTLQGSCPAAPDGMRDASNVPAFPAFSPETPAMKGDFSVRHFTSDAVQKRDPKYREFLGGKRVDGVLYPRAGTLGGCTAHNAM